MTFTAFVDLPKNPLTGARRGVVTRVSAVSIAGAMAKVRTRFSAATAVALHLVNRADDKLGRRGGAK